MLKYEMLNKNIWAVVGVTKDEHKFGYKIFKKLIEHGYETYGVNPNYETIDGEKIYPNLKSIPKGIEVVDVVVPSRVTINILDEINELGIKYVWFQPGTFDDEVINKAKNLSLKIIYDDCVYKTLMETEKR